MQPPYPNPKRDGVGRGRHDITSETMRQNVETQIAEMHEDALQGFAKLLGTKPKGRRR